jgi:hypothetical protein
VFILHGSTLENLLQLFVIMLDLNDGDFFGGHDEQGVTEDVRERETGDLVWKEGGRFMQAP